MTFAKAIRARRKELNYSQQKVANDSELKRSYISLLESGEIKKPSAEKLIKLAKGLKVDPEYLFQAAGYVTKAQRSVTLDLDENVWLKDYLSLSPKAQSSVGGIIDHLRREEQRERIEKEVKEKNAKVS